MTVAESDEEAGNRTGKGNLLFQNGREATCSLKVRRKGQKQKKSLVLSQNLKKAEGSSRSLRGDLEQELLTIIYGFESSFERTADCRSVGVPEAGCSSISQDFSGTYCQFDSEDDVLDDESDCCIESDFEYGFIGSSSGELTIELTHCERVRNRDKVKVRSKGKHQKYENLRNLCKKFAHPSELKKNRSKNAKHEKFVICQENEKERNGKENAERKLNENTSYKCFSWEAVPEMSSLQKKKISKLRRAKNSELKETTKRERLFKKLRKHPLLQNNSTDVNKVIKPKNYVNRSKEISFPKQLHIIELFKRKSKKKKKSILCRCTKDLSDYGFSSVDLWLDFSDEECYDDWVSNEYCLPEGSYVISEHDIMSRLLELQRREITPEDFDLLLQLESSVAPKTVSKSVVDNLKIDRYTKESDVVEQCTICMEDYKDGSVRKYLSCGHAFHSQCIGTWLTTSSTKCPIDTLEVCPDEEKHSC